MTLALCQKVVSEWREIFEHLALALHKAEEHWEQRRSSQDRIGRTRTLLTSDFKAILDGAARG